MNNSKKSFVLHIDSLDILDDLTNEQAGLLFKAIKAHQSGEIFTLDQITKMVFLPFKNQFERDNEKYIKTCEKRAIAGAKGGKQKVANASNCKQKVANLADSDSKNKNKSESKSERFIFVVPTVEDVFLYFQERGFQKNEAERFYDFYQSKGWMVGKNKMKDWKAAVRNWTKDKTPSINKSTMTPRAFTQ